MQSTAKRSLVRVHPFIFTNTFTKSQSFHKRPNTQGNEKLKLTSITSALCHRTRRLKCNSFNLIWKRTVCPVYLHHLLLNGRKLSLKYYGLWIHHWVVPEHLCNVVFFIDLYFRFTDRPLMLFSCFLCWYCFFVVFLFDFFLLVFFLVFFVYCFLFYIFFLFDFNEELF